MGDVNKVWPQCFRRYVLQGFTGSVAFAKLKNEFRFEDTDGGSEAGDAVFVPRVLKGFDVYLFQPHDQTEKIMVALCPEKT